LQAKIGAGKMGIGFRRWRGRCKAWPQSGLS
jgi:hypothetical protein